MKADEILFAVISSAGGIGFLIWMLAKSIGKHIAEDLNIKYQHSLDKKMEKFKSDLELDRTIQSSKIENKQYITKVKFDVELHIYRELSKDFMDMVKCCSFLFTEENYYFDGKRDNDFWIKKSLDAIKAVDRAQTTLYQNAAFISEELYDLYNTLLKKSQDIIFALSPLSPNHQKVWSPNEKDLYVSNQVFASKSLLDDMKKLNGILRDYLSTLVVI